MAGQVVECIACGHVGATKLRGNIFITIILLFFWIIPGIMYMAWRRGGSVCSACGSNNVKLFIPIQKVPMQKQPTPIIVRDAFQNNANHLSNMDGDVELKSCPFCAEPIRISAIKCKHCGSMLEK